MKRAQRGFTVVELLVGAAIASIVAFAAIALIRQTAAVAASLSQRLTAQASAAQIAGRLSAEASSAWAVFVPTSDLAGMPNVDGHEVDFFSEDGAHRPFAWAYRYDAAARTLTRYSYAPGRAAIAGESLAGIDAFHAVSDDAGGIASPSSALYDPLFAATVVRNVDYGFDALPAALGGNRMTLVTISAQGVRASDTLDSGTTPTTFTIRVTYTPAPVLQTATPSPLPVFPS